MAVPKRFRTFAKESWDRAAAAPLDAHLAGDTLRQRRQELGIELGDVAAALKIKRAYLEALEQDCPDRLPAPVYAIGFMRAYADYLGLDGEEVLRRFKQESSGLTAKPDLSFPIKLAEGDVPGSGMLLVALILVTCGYGTWYYVSSGERSRPERVASVPGELFRANPEPDGMHPVFPHSAEAALSQAIAPAGEGNALAGSTNRPLGVSAAASPSVPSPSFDATANPARRSSAASGAADRPAGIVIRATAESWVQISDGRRSVLVARVLKPGENYEVPGEPGLTMRTGNAGGLSITVGGNPVPPIGPAGAVRRKVALDPQALSAGTAVRE